MQNTYTLLKVLKNSACWKIWGNSVSWISKPFNHSWRIYNISKGEQLSIVCDTNRSVNVWCNLSCAKYEFGTHFGIVVGSKKTTHVKVIAEILYSSEPVDGSSITESEVDKEYCNVLTNLRLMYVAKYPGKQINGYIQGNSLTPFYMIMFSGWSIRYLLDLAMLKISGKKSLIYYYYTQLMFIHKIQMNDVFCR